MTESLYRSYWKIRRFKMKGAEFIALTWEKIDEMVRKIAGKIRDSGFEPDIILGVSKGGLIPAVLLSDKIGVDVDIIGVQYYTGIKETKERPEITQEVSTDLHGKRVLVIDDVADTGHSLQLVMNYVKEKGAEKIVTCTLHYKPWSAIKPDCYLKETEAWVIYPWEINEMSKSRQRNLRNTE